MLFVDVHVGVDQIARITIYEGDTAEDLAEDFAVKHGKQRGVALSTLAMDEAMKQRLVKVLHEQMASVLSKIEEVEDEEPLEEIIL